MLLNKITKNNKYICKFLNLTIYAALINHQIKIEKFFNIFEKYRKYTNNGLTKKFKIFDFTLYEYSETENFIYKKNIFYSKYINKLSAIKKYLHKKIDKKYTKIFILKSNLGEAYIFLKYIINNLTKKEDKILIAGTRKAHINLANIFMPGIETILLKKSLPEINNNTLNINEQTFYIAFPMNFYINSERNICENDAIYIDEIYKYFNIKHNNELKNNSIIISEETHKKIDNYLNKYNISKFIFLVEDAKTCTSIPRKFWNELENSLEVKVIKNNENMKIEEAICFASKSEAIISLRSGLSEILSETNTTQIVLYTDFINRFRFKPINTSKIINGYSIKTLALTADNIIELKYCETSQKQLIKYITETITKKKELTK